MVENKDKAVVSGWIELLQWKKSWYLTLCIMFSCIKTSQTWGHWMSSSQLIILMHICIIWKSHYTSPKKNHYWSVYFWRHSKYRQTFVSVKPPFFFFLLLSSSLCVGQAVGSSLLYEEMQTRLRCKISPLHTHKKPYWFNTALPSIFVPFVLHVCGCADCTDIRKLSCCFCYCCKTCVRQELKKSLWPSYLVGF